MSSPEREGPSTDPKGLEDTREEPVGQQDSLERTLVDDEGPAGAGAPAEPDGGDAEVDEDADTKIADRKREEDLEASDTQVVPPEAAESEAAKAEPSGLDSEADTTVMDSVAAGTDGVRVQYYGQTDVGLVREHNEDNFMVADLDAEVRDLDDGKPRSAKVGDRGAIFAVCDGMGGAAAGEVASQMAVDTIYEFFTHVGNSPKDRDHFARRLVASIEEAGNRIFSAAKMDRSRRGMGTTATVAGLIDKVLFVGQVGDSRAYLLRGEDLGLITKDQSLVNQLIEAGQLTDEEAEAFEHSNIILQALGTTEDVTVDLTFIELRRGDRLMLCSDGLSGLVHQDMIKEVLQTTPDLGQASRRLIEMANAGGGHDNITVVCAEFAGEGLAEARPDDRVMYQQYPLPIAEDEDHESIPPRETSIKEGGRKPGADVKRRDDETVPAVPSAREEEADEPVRPFSWGLVLVILLLAAIATAVAVAMGGQSGEDVEATEQDRAAEGAERERAAAAAAAEEEAEDVQQPVEVRVVTDVDGELWIDGQGYGPLTEGEDVYVELLPGPHRFEAISGGNVVTSAIITLRAGVPADVALTMPSGVTEAPGEGEEGEGEEPPPQQVQRDTGEETTPPRRPTKTDRTGTTMATTMETPEETGTSPTAMETTTTEPPTQMRRTEGTESGRTTTMTTMMATEEEEPPPNPFE